MKKYLLLIVPVFLFTGNLLAQETDQSEMMAAWQAYMTPGPMHEMLAKNVGTWKAEMTTYENPDAPYKSEGTSTYHTILGGRYLQGKHTSVFGDMEMEGYELTGYDNAKKRFFSTWVDNFGTGVLYQEGDYDEATKTLTFSGVTIDPMGQEIKVRQILKILDDDHSFMEMYMEQNGKESKWMEINFTRVK